MAQFHQYCFVLGEFYQFAQRKRIFFVMFLVFTFHTPKNEQLSTICASDLQITTVKCLFSRLKSTTNSQVSTRSKNGYFRHFNKKIESSFESIKPIVIVLSAHVRIVNSIEPEMQPCGTPRTDKTFFRRAAVHPLCLWLKVNVKRTKKNPVLFAVP